MVVGAAVTRFSFFLLRIARSVSAFPVFFFKWRDVSVGPFETIHGGVSGRAAPSVVRAQRGVSAFAAAPFRHSDTPCCPENARAAAALNNRRAGETGGRCVLGTSWASPQRMRGDTCCCREQLRRCAWLRSSKSDRINTNTHTSAVA